MRSPTNIGSRFQARLLDTARLPSLINLTSGRRW